MRLSDLAEADMSRRQFLKVGGQAAMAAAAPKTALKGLMGGPKSAGTAAIDVIPKTPKAMKAALLKWIKDNNLEQHWRMVAKEDLRQHPPKNFANDMAALQKAGKKYFKSWEEYKKFAEDDYIDTFKNEILSRGDPFYDEPAYIEDLQHVLDDRADERITAGIPMPKWVTRFQVSQWMGRDVGMNHPFVQDREEWLKHFNSGVWGKPEDMDQLKEKEFDNIIRSSMSPARYKEGYGNQDEPVKDTEEDKGFTQADYDKAVKDKKEFEGPEYNSGNWSSQSVEFENRLRRLL